MSDKPFYVLCTFCLKNPAVRDTRSRVWKRNTYCQECGEYLTEWHLWQRDRNNGKSPEALRDDYD